MNQNILFLGTPADADYLAMLKPFFKGWNVSVVIGQIELLSHLEMYCAKKQISRVVSTSPGILNRLVSLEGTPEKTPSIDNYAGSLFSYKNLEIVFIDPLKQLQTVSYGKHVTERFISKVIAPEKWAEPTQFKWEIASPSSYQSIYETLSQAFAIAIDIETKKNPLRIDCISFTGVYLNSDGNCSHTHTYVLELKTLYDLEWIKKFCQLPAPKVFANGKYDNAYLLRYGISVHAWFWDVQHLFHSWFSELPKDLGFLNAYFLRKVVYWKDLAETFDRREYLRYNGLDTWATINVWVQQMLLMPGWARKNYLLEFPLVFPCLLAEMTGIERDAEAHKRSREDVDQQEEKMLGSLRRSIGIPNFNPGSWQQVQKLMIALGCKDLAEKGTGEKVLAAAKYRHPLDDRILSMIAVPKGNPNKSIRGLRKLATTYLRTEDDAKQSGIHAGEGGAKEFYGRILYALNPHGTDTARLASREHHFWCGIQIQNIPVGTEVKCTLRASEGFYLGECDLEQAESRDTAHIAGDTNLISAVSGTSDFHSVNCSAFFGIPYSDIFDDSTGKTKNKPLRDLAKRVNHGANYNMGPGVLVDTMGLKHIWEAAKLLGLAFKEPKKVAEYLLAQFHRTYPNIAKVYYAHVINEIGLSSKLTSRAFHHTEYNDRTYDVSRYIEQGDWTRYCFGDPGKSKSDLNSYVAHAPQSLNARTLNEAFMKVFYEIALPNPETFRLHAQIHDSILFSYAAGFDQHAEQVRDCMEIPVTVRDVSGTHRTFTVPAALKLGKKDKVTGEFKRAVYWSETE